LKKINKKKIYERIFGLIYVQVASWIPLDIEFD